jgi:serine/threonine protein kinase
MKIIKSINRGGYGEVFEAQLPNGERVAIKKFNPQGSLTPATIEKLRKRFVREVKIQQSLAKHGGTLPILETGLKDEPPWFTMPLASQNYREQINTDKKAGVISKDPLADILNCLEGIHLRGVIHRDLKPENILQVNGRWYLADLGLAMSTDSVETTKLSTTGYTYGSVSYMAPEQYHDFSRVTAAVDIFSFGCILHDLVDGGSRAPYSTVTTTTKWDSVIRKCTAEDPSKRFVSIKALREVVIQTARKHSSLTQSPDTIAWTAELEKIDEWDQEKFVELAKNVEKDPPGLESGVMAELTAEHLDVIKKKHSDVWFRIGHAYSIWISSGFTWAFCDVIADRAVTFFDDVTDLELKAEIIVGLAQLAANNHRYYVMREFVRRCGPDLDEYTAERIQLEFQAGEHESLLEKCIEDLHGYSVESYHSLILDLIKPK